jgi:hypothetical protein
MKSELINTIKLIKPSTEYAEQIIEYCDEFYSGGGKAILNGGDRVQGMAHIESFDNHWLSLFVYFLIPENSNSKYLRKLFFKLKLGYLIHHS